MAVVVVLAKSKQKWYFLCKKNRVKMVPKQVFTVGWGLPEAPYGRVKPSKLLKPEETCRAKRDILRHVFM